MGYTLKKSLPTFFLIIPHYPVYGGIIIEQQLVAEIYFDINTF